jgi:ABC-type antimicrobial peptide transport system ATPase subunit
MQKSHSVTFRKKWSKTYQYTQYNYDKHPNYLKLLQQHTTNTYPDEMTIYYLSHNFSICKKVKNAMAISAKPHIVIYYTVSHVNSISPLPP